MSSILRVGYQHCSKGTGNMQASWRTDPKQSGMGGAIGDIGTHAANLAEYITGFKITEICAMLNTVVKGRLLDDDSSMLIRFDNGATGVLLATQVAAGEENNLNIRVYGEKGGLEWKQEDPNTMILKWLDQTEGNHPRWQGYLSRGCQAIYAHTCWPPRGIPRSICKYLSSVHQSSARLQTRQKNQHAKI